MTGVQTCALPIFKDGDIWGDTDVYGVRLPLPGDSKPLVLGQVLEGMTPDAPVVEGEDAKKRTDALWKLSEAVTKRANEADKLKLPSIRELGFDEAIRAVAKTAKPEDLIFLLRCMIARELSQTRSWYGKLMQALEWKIGRAHV